MDKDELLKFIKKLSREEQMNREEEFGRLRSKTWGGKPSSKEERRKNKLKLRTKVDRNNLDELE